VEVEAEGVAGGAAIARAARVERDRRRAARADGRALGASADDHGPRRADARHDDPDRDDLRRVKARDARVDAEAEEAVEPSPAELLPAPAAADLDEAAVEPAGGAEVAGDAQAQAPAVAARVPWRA
jgi:hypothetical protein